MSRHYMFFNFVATLKKDSRKEVETGAHVRIGIGVPA